MLRHARHNCELMRKSLLIALMVACICTIALVQVQMVLSPSQALAAGEELPPQTILPPGLYLYQTRTRDGTCDDAPRTGFVNSTVATLDGVPGSRVMTMELVNSKYWPTWKLEVKKGDVIVGTANLMGAKDATNGSTRIELRANKDRFQGQGSRTYFSTIKGKKVPCTLNYDALLKPLD